MKHGCDNKNPQSFEMAKAKNFAKKLKPKYEKRTGFIFRSFSLKI